MNLFTTFQNLMMASVVFCLLSSIIYYKNRKKCGMQIASYELSDGTVAKTSTLQRKIDNIFNQIDQTFPPNKITIKEKTSSAKNSKVFLRNPKSNYCVGDNLIVQVEMFDYHGNKKTYGGDYLRARMFTSELQAAASGRIEDFHNGTYHVHFILFWEGNVTISIFLMHPSEGVSTLWKVRNKWHGYVKHTGKFTRNQHIEEVKCGFELNKTQELCEYKDKQEEEYFYCVKPQNFSCGSLTDVKSMYTYETLFTEFEKSLFTKFNVRVEIPKDFNAINVLSCSKSTTEAKCTLGKKLEYPSGYVMKNQWYPKACSMVKYDHLEEMGKCLERKFIYLFGDSTTRLWIRYFQSNLKTLAAFTLHEDNWSAPIFFLDLKKNMKIHWKRHTFPFVSFSYGSWKEERTVSREIDLIPGDQRTVIVIAIGVHFRPYPIYLYIRRLLNIRSAIERLFLRSPQTKVIIKTENTCPMNENLEVKSDFHASVHYSIIEIIFADLKVGFVNGWDMTNAYDSNNLHPPVTVIGNEIKMLMTYIC